MRMMSSGDQTSTTVHALTRTFSLLEASTSFSLYSSSRPMHSPRPIPPELAARAVSATHKPSPSNDGHTLPVVNSLSPGFANTWMGCWPALALTSGHAYPLRLVPSGRTIFQPETTPSFVSRDFKCSVSFIKSPITFLSPWLLFRAVCRNRTDTRRR